MADLRNLNEALKALEGRAIQTSQGSFIKLEDLQELLGQFKEGQAIDRVSQLAGPKSFAAAKQAAKKDEALQEQFRKPPEEALAREAFKGQSLPTASEGVKS